MKPGDMLGRYRIDSELGVGGMGEVYRAHDSRLGREVAIKTVNAVYTERFEREAHAISALNHPNICTLYDVGSHQGTGYLVMELVDGQPPRGPLPWTEAVRIVASVCDALGAAHRKHIIHRDLKPGNVLLTELGVKVIDFGLAKQEHADESTASLLSAPGSVMGTVSYMAPEQAAGKPADARSDLWAAGMILFELLTGRLPYRSQNASAIIAEILDPTPLTLEFPPGLPPEVVRIGQKLLAKDPAERYQHADDVAVDLRAVLKTPTSGRQSAPEAAATGRAPTKRRRLWWSAAGAALLIVAAALGIWQWRTPRAHAPLPSKVAEANDCLARALSFLAVRQDLPRARQQLEKALALDSTFAHARAWYGFTDVALLDSGISNDTSWLYKAEAELRRALQDDPYSARAHASLAMVYEYQGRGDLVPEEARRALELDPNERDGWMTLAWHDQWIGEYEQSQSIFKRLIAADPLFFPARSNIGENLRQMGDPAGSIREQEKVFEQDPNSMFAFVFVTLARMTTGELPQARAALNRGRTIEPQNYQVRVLWALLLALEGKRDEALREMDPEVLKWGQLIVAASNVAEFYVALGDRSKALDWLDIAVRAGDERAEWFERDPLLASVKGEPRFKQIVDGIRSRREHRQRMAR